MTGRRERVSQTPARAIMCAYAISPSALSLTST